MDMVFLTILNMSLTGAFVILAIWLARIPLRKAPKIISYCLWAVAGFRLVFPFSVEGLFSLIPFGAQPIPLDITHGVAVDIPTHSPPVMSNANIYNAHGVYSFPDFSYANILGGSGTESLGGGGFSELPHIATVANPLVTLVSIGTYVWFFGALVMLLYGLVSYFLLKQRLKNCTPDAQKIYTTDDIKSPFVLGFFSPKIYLPLNLPESEREYIILHEQTHIRRYDHIIKFVAYIILCLHWFNPLVWSAFSLMSKDMEMSCDERVLKELGSTIKKSYSMSLLSLATEGRYASSPLAFGEHGIKERVKNVLNFKRHSKIFVGVVVLLTVIFGAGFMFSRTDAAHTEEEFILGYFPTHDASIVTFAENARISLYLEDTPIDLRGRNIYPEPSFSGNFHTVYLPVEPVFDAIGLEYDWNEIRNIFRILGTANEHLTLRPDSPSWGATQINFLPGSPNQPSLLLRKDSGFYLHSNAFNSILGEYPFSGYYGETFYGIAQSWTPLIYHDLEKVILVTNAEIRNPHFERKHWLMVYQFMRAEHPILDTISVWINTHVGDDVLSMRPPTEEVTLETGQPFVVTTRISDYVMLPLVEILELLELDFSINEYGVRLPVEMRRITWIEDSQIIPMDYIQITDGVPVFTLEDQHVPWFYQYQLHQPHEVTPMIVDDVLYISHTDLAHMLFLHFRMDRIFSLSLNRALSQIYISAFHQDHAAFPIEGFMDYRVSVWGDAPVTNTENGRVVLYDITSSGYRGPLPEGRTYRTVWQFDMRNTPDQLEATLFVNGETPYEGELVPTYTRDGHRYVATFEITANAPIYTLELLLDDPRNIAVVGLYLNIYPI